MNFKPSRRSSLRMILLVALAATIFPVLWSCVAPEALAPLRARAQLRGTEGRSVDGVVRFEEHPDGGLRVETRVRGLPKGTHAYHVHVYGDCSAPDARSAGTHYNFIGSSLDPPQDIERITGNLGEIVSSGQGTARHEGRVTRAQLAGIASIAGRSVVVHARGNDPSAPPIGDAGGRIACGVIGFDGPPSS